MSDKLPIVLVPGLNCSARLWAEQIPALWRFGPVTVADHTRADSMQAIARQILAEAPPRFALAGLSMGGYIVVSMLREAPQRVTRLALLDTAPYAETPEQTARRMPLIELAQSGRFAEVPDRLWPVLVHRSRQGDGQLRAINRLMAEETGPDAFVRQQRAIISRPDSTDALRSVKCPTLILVGDADALTPPRLSREMHKLVPHSRLFVVPDCGHLSTIERPEAVNQAMIEWMKA
jgi:pimeloyl-ACP methyl ester carboxylesterase